MSKKVLSMVLAVATLLSVGCGSNSNSTSTKETSTTPTKTEVTSDETTDNKETASNQSGSKEIERTWPEGYTIKWFIRGGTADYNNYKFHELKSIEKIEEKLGVNIEFIVANGDNEAIGNQYLLMISSGELPDVIQYLHNEAYVGGIPQLYQEGVSIELNDLIDKHMPNLQAIFEKYPEIAKDMRNNDGKYLYFQKINPMDTEYDITDAAYQGLVMRKDWLENVGLEVPTTINEWYEVLKAFKTMDPNGNGLNDEIPFDGGGAGINLLLGAYKMGNGAFMDQGTDKVNYGPATQQYKAFLEEMNKWHSEGLLQNCYDAEGKWASSKLTDEDIVADIAGAWKGLANNWEKFLPEIQKRNPSAELVAVPYPKADDGIAYTTNTKFSYNQRETTLITTDCEYPEAVAAVVDYMYSEEGSELMVWGIEGETFEKDANGNRTLTDYGAEKIDYYDGNIQRVGLYAPASTGFPRFGMNDFYATTRSEKYLEACQIWGEVDKRLLYPTGITLSADEQAKIKEATGDMLDYIGQMQWKFITGQEPLSNFDAYLATLDRMGINEMIAIYQNAYDEYLKR